MQKNVETIRKFFPEAKIKTDVKTLKFTMFELDIFAIYKIREVCEKCALNVKVKRSGTGLTVIFSLIESEIPHSDQ